MRAFDRGATVHGAFFRQAVETPLAIAVRSGADQHSYQAIAVRADALARHLHTLGVSPGDRVALLAERSPETIIAMLAILACGAAFVPLDPAYPPARLAVMLEDARPGLVLARQDLMTAELAVTVTAQARACVLADLDQALALSDLLAQQPLPEFAQAAGPMDAAYIMYTSGSTGRPKGVVVPHRAIVRLVHEQDYARFAPDEVFLHLAPLAFDASTFEIWGALLNGATLGVVPQPRPSLDDIVGHIAAYGATTAWFTAGLFHLLVEQRLDGLKPLRQILAGGDVLSPAHMRRARLALPQCRFINGYGPTENTTFSCCHAILDPLVPGLDGTGGNDAPIPIGRPIAHGHAYVLDEAFKPVPVGQVGQLCVGGDGLALGYFDAPELTAAKFVEVPSPQGFSGQGGAGTERLYLTGDLACERPDGVLDFLGRMDRQLKLDGKRVEIEEIETALRDQPGVADAVVVVREQPGGIRRLAAFLKPIAAQLSQPGQTVDGVADGMGERLRRVLPSHMVPSMFVETADFPLTVNGKIDRDSLLALLPQASHAPSPSAARSPAAPVIVAPSALAAVAFEDAVAAAWGAVLGIPDVPRDVNFFDLGGTSLLLMGVHARLGASGISRLPIVVFFECPTVASLAARLRRENAAVQAPPMAMAEPQPVARGRDAARRAALQRFRGLTLEQAP